ncbi:MAG TPA: hypothetical protein VKX16_11245 [Chloroflexota bacterium]|nr:hypothetical protein [Chloroflexota bacterium]
MAAATDPGHTFSGALPFVPWSIPGHGITMIDRRSLVGRACIWRGRENVVVET